MELLLFIVSVLISLIIIYQDFTKRRINLILTLIFNLTIILFYYKQNTGTQLLNNAVFSLLYLLTCYFILRLFFNLNGQKDNSIMDHMIGWGDIIILLAIGSTFEPDKMIYFFGFSFVASILIHLIFSKRTKSIPLAAYLLLFYNCLMVYGILEKS
jgi:hypothetical protein